MAADDTSSNPFSAIFSSPETLDEQVTAADHQRRDVGDALSRIFLCSPTPTCRTMAGNQDRLSRPKCLVALPQLARDLERSGKTSVDLDFDSLAMGVVERLQMTHPSATLVRCGQGRTDWLYSESQAVETCTLTYLTHCYTRAYKEMTTESKMMEAEVCGHVVEECKKVILEMCTSVLMRPVHDKFISLFIQSINHLGTEPAPIEFYYRIAESYSDNQEMLGKLYEPVLKTVVGSPSLSSQSLSPSLSILETFVSHPTLTKVMVESRLWIPPESPNRSGRTFEKDTLLGRLLSPSSIPMATNRPSDCFPPDPSMLHRNEAEGVRFSVQTQLEAHVDRVYKVFKILLRRGQETKMAVIRWLVQCLENNRDRGKMLARMQPVMNSAMSPTASDGFFLNLGWVMLKLAAPFAKRDAPLIRSIDPHYCLAKSTGSESTLLLNFSSDTRMAPMDPEDQESLESTPVTSETELNFITHCFFLTHQTLSLGITQILQRFSDLMGHYERTFRTLRSIVNTSGPVGPLYDQINSQFLLLHSQVQGFKAHMEDPQLQQLCLSFYATTARWLVWLVTQDSHDSSSKSHDSSSKSYDSSSKSHDPVDPDTLFPLPLKAPLQMKAVPECLVDNISHFFTHLRRSESDILKSETRLLSHLITFATIFMGAPQFIKNPHTRANIAQLVSLMIPSPEQEDNTGLIPLGLESQQVLFEEHKVASTHLLRMLMKIFVDIEFTGDSMEFEAKFQYRIPMYNILRFVWPLSTYQTSIKVLVSEAVNYNGSKQELPTLLRFINMIINDATLQLDEGLENLVTIGDLQKKKKSEWDSYNDEQKKEYQQKMQEATMMARNRNQLASYTVDVLKLITRDLQAPFVLASMVGRISAMLNYVLKQLVGPGRRQLHVEEMEKFHFHPKKLVASIVAIYVNLGQSPEFCHALPQDGRSFSIELLLESARIMRSLGHVELVEKMTSLIERVQKISNYLKMEEKVLDDAPDEFLDPVTNELMKEPVLLPTSGVTMDKANVIRHLLSDGTDPFNRSPLTADMLEPDHQLEQKIHEWKTQKLAHLQDSLSDSLRDTLRDSKNQ